MTSKVWGASQESGSKGEPRRADPRKKSFERS